MAAMSTRLLLRSTTTAASRRFLLSAAARSFSVRSETQNQHDAKRGDPMEDLPNEEYCSITVGEYMIRSPQNTISHTLRFLVNRGMDGLHDAPEKVYHSQSSGPVERYEAKKVEEGLFLRMDVPGVDKEGLMIWAEKNEVFIVGDGRKESEHDDYGRRHNAKIELCPNANYETEKIKADLKFRVLRMLIPKKKPFSSL